jgi:hypothetical protein
MVHQAEHLVASLYAQALLGRLRETMKDPLWARSGDAQGWLREAEVIELDLNFPAEPFTPPGPGAGLRTPERPLPPGPKVPF